MSESESKKVKMEIVDEIDDYDVVTVSSCDGREFTISTKIAKKSVTIMDLLDDIGYDHVIFLPNVTGDVFAKCIDFYEHRMQNPLEDEDDEESSRDVVEEVRRIIPWEGEVDNVDQLALQDLILAANYLDFKDCMTTCLKTVAKMINGKTTVQLRELFNIENDFGPGEEERVREDNRWCE
jgi:S-phase kinase-associated protein 1